MRVINNRINGALGLILLFTIKTEEEVECFLTFFVSLFELSDDEMKDALKKYPELDSQDSEFVCDKNSANASMEPGKNKDGYFDNVTILKQFERLFKMLEFKTVFKNTEKVIFIDNARTHSAKKYDKTLLFKKSGTNCPYESLEWIEDGETKTVSFFFDERKENSKGLFVMCQDLKLIPEDADQKSKDFSLTKLREIISKHPAFDERSNLEILGDKYGIKVLFLPKFHCELNPIESVWCFMKNFVRKRTDQRYETMLKLIEEAKEVFKQTNINIKLWRRFWQAINMYKSGQSYSEVIRLLYGAKTHEIKQHRQIYNTKL
jgi:dsDNA-binding SOS-regulon protein